MFRSPTSRRGTSTLLQQNKGLVIIRGLNLKWQNYTLGLGVGLQAPKVTGPLCESILGYTNIKDDKNKDRQRNQCHIGEAGVTKRESPEAWMELPASRRSPFMVTSPSPLKCNIRLCIENIIKI